MDRVMKNSIFRYILLIFLLSGCYSATDLKSSYSFPEGLWSRFDNPVLDFNIDNPGIFYDMFLEVDFDISQRHEQFSITVIMNTPSGEIRHRDLVLDFAKKDESGKPGVLRLVLRREFAFSDKGACSFEIENRSAKVKNPGINSISIILEKSQ